MLISSHPSCCRQKLPDEVIELSLPSLLRAHRERPPQRCTAEKVDEFAPPHCVPPGPEMPRTISRPGHVACEPIQRLSPNVKVFGCRPCCRRCGALGAGVRKPAREETAGRDTAVVGVGYGDLSAVGDWCREAAAGWLRARQVMEGLGAALNGEDARTIGDDGLAFACAPPRLIEKWRRRRTSLGNCEAGAVMRCRF